MFRASLAAGVHRACQAYRRLRHEEADARGKAVQVRLAGDGSDLAVAEEAGDGQPFEALGQRCGVMVPLAEQAYATPVARAQQRPGRRAAERGGRRVEHRAQIFVRRARVTHLELQRLPDAWQRAHRQRAARAVGSDQIADEEVAAAELVSVLVHGQADEQVTLRPLLHFFRKTTEGIGEHLVRWPLADRPDHLTVHAGDCPRPPDRRRALGDDGAQGPGAADRCDDCAGIEHLTVEEEMRPPCRSVARRHAADDRRANVCLGQRRDQPLGIDRERVAEADPAVARVGRDAR